MKFREITLKSGGKILLGKDAESNDELMKKFKGKENIILHTEEPGSPFCVIDAQRPGKSEINSAGVACAKFSQAWRETKNDVVVNIFTGKDISKPWLSKKGTWKVKNSRKIKINKKDILNFEKTLGGK